MERKDEFVSNFPTKRQVNGSLQRKRQAIKKNWYKCKRIHSSNGHFGDYTNYYMTDANGNYVENIHHAVRFHRKYRPQESKKQKIYCNRKLRRSSKFKNMLFSGNMYRKAIDYIWNFSDY